MDERRILRFRRRAPDGSTTPLLSPGQAEQISEAMLERERKAHGKLRAALRWHWNYGVKSLERIEPPSRRAAIVRQAMRNVNNGWAKVLLTFGPMFAFATLVALGGWQLGTAWEMVAGIAVVLPGLVIHKRFMRREIEALVARELEGDRAGL